MNEIQQKLLEIAKEYIKVCEKLNLRYFASGGTVLGAMRHGGFIPWDDDMDFQMPRKDYEIFVKEGQKYLPDYLFVQIHDTDKKYLMPFAKVRDSRTTAIDKYYSNLKINQGLWIDIFPLDDLPLSIRKQKLLNWFDNQFLRRRYMPHRYKMKGFKTKFANTMVRICLPSKTLAYKWSKYIAVKYSFKNEGNFYWNNVDGRFIYHMKKEWFDNFKLVKFEDIEIRVPFDVLEFLEDHYGDWKQLPPKENQVTNHEFSIVDLSKSYVEYMKD